jgi:Holliday junction resolvase RusA-like endonuclease
MKHIVLDLDTRLPSINHKYIIARGKLILSRQYREIKAHLTSKCLKINLDPPYRVEIYVETASDIDNGLKIILDSITSAIDDDKNVLDLRIIKKKIKRAKAGRILVTVESIPIPDYSFFDSDDKILSFKN